MQQVRDNWYEDFFRGINCEIWENAIPEEMTQTEVDFLVSELNLQEGHRILDVPCGAGRHAILLAKRGFSVTGIDISKTFIDGLKARIHAEDLQIRAIEANILVTEIDQKFNAAICLGNSFGYFDFQGMKVFVQKVSNSLEPGAKFIINSGMLAESIFPNLARYAEHKTYTVGNITMEIDNQYNADEGYLVSNLNYTKEGSTEEHRFKHYVFTLSEVKRLLKMYGMTVIAAYNSVSKESYKLGDQQVYLVAQKD
ncbi:MAG: class I SAM-dependent methyltransferase [Ferruginibacter sp.]|nr:class I SAM-dependent methyltransferase [Ferruginibacter sp.]